MATISNGISYSSTLDIWRYEYESHFKIEPYVNIDHIVFQKSIHGYAAYLLSMPIHWPNQNDWLVINLPNNYRYPMQEILKQKREMKVLKR